MSFRDYLLAGWKLCNIPPGFKGPHGAAARGWQRRENAISNPDIGPIIAGAGLCHAWSGTVAIDVDFFEEAAKWLTLNDIDLGALLAAKTSVQITSGRDGRAKLLYKLPVGVPPLATVKLAPYSRRDDTGAATIYHALEFRCATAEGQTVQDVLPPTIHPNTGRPYEWRYGDDLTGHWSNLPELPPAVLALWQAQLQRAAPAGPVAAIGVELAEIEKLLGRQDPDAPYDEWLKVGAAIHHETRGSPAGLALWDKWSRQGSKYGESKDGKPPQLPAEKWPTFHLDTANPVTLGSLRADMIADVADFPVSAEPTGTKRNADTRPETLIKQLLEARLCFVKVPSSYYDWKTDELLNDNAVRHVFGPQMPLIENAKGVPTKPDPIRYLKDSTTKQIAHAIGLHPGAGQFYEEDGQRYVNRYTPSTVQTLLPTERELALFDMLWDQLADPIMRVWLKQYYAFALKKPGEKITMAPLLVSPETRTGKTAITLVIPRLLFGSKWVAPMSGAVLRSAFTDTLGSAWWIVLPELRTGSNKTERDAYTNRMKEWITDEVIEIHPKGLKPFKMKNRIQIAASSNYLDALQIDNHERRWAVCEMKDTIPEKASIDLEAFLRSSRAAGVLRHIFLGVAITGFNHRGNAPTSTAKSDMTRLGQGSWESNIVSKMIAGEAPFNRDLFMLKDAHALVGSGMTEAMLASMLKHGPFYCVNLGNDGAFRRWVWRNAEQWKKCSGSERTRYVETGERPQRLEWSDAIPPRIAQLGAEYEDVAPAPDLAHSAEGLT